MKNKKPIVNVTVTRKGQSVSIIDDTVLINGKPRNPYYKDVRALLTKPLIVKLYNDAVAQVKKLPKKHLKNRTFDSLVSESKHLLSIKDTLQAVRELNSGERSLGFSRHSSKTLEEKISEELGPLFGDIFRGFDYYTDRNKLSLPQQNVLDVLTPYIGHELDIYDFEKRYNPIKDDNSKADTLIVIFKTFPFEKYVSQKTAKEIITKAKKLYKDHCDQIKAFQQIRDIAGNDIVNWGPHKYAAQGKKHNICTSWRVQDWGDQYAEHLKKSGVKLTEKKKSSVQKLKEKASSNSALTALTQDDYVKLFKNESERQAHTIISNMTVETAVSLLDLKTKNVTSKLIFKSQYRNSVQPLSTLRYIVKKVSENPNVDAFKKLKTYFKTNNVSYVDWDFLTTYASHYSINEFLTWVNADHDSKDLEDYEFDDTFFNTVISKLPKEEKLNLHYALTDAVIVRTSDTEKSEFLKSYRNVPKVLARLGHHDKDFANIHWSFSADRFFNLPYQEIKEFITETDPNDGSVEVLSEANYFAPAIIKHRDSKTARLALIQRKVDYNWDTSDYYKGVFNILSFNQKVSVLKNADTQYDNFDIKRVFPKNSDQDRFFKVALKDISLCHHIPDLPISMLNKNVTESKENTGRNIFVPLKYETAEALSRKNIIKLLKADGFVNNDPDHGYRRGRLGDRFEVKKITYSKITRKDYDSIFNTKIYEHHDSIALIDHMTPQEIIKACDWSDEFLQVHINKVEKIYLVNRFSKKEAFKSIVGDRRNRCNDEFGCALEARLAK